MSLDDAEISLRLAARAFDLIDGQNQASRASRALESAELSLANCNCMMPLIELRNANTAARKAVWAKNKNEFKSDIDQATQNFNRAILMMNVNPC